MSYLSDLVYFSLNSISRTQDNSDIYNIIPYAVKNVPLVEIYCSILNGTQLLMECVPIVKATLIE